MRRHSFASSNASLPAATSFEDAKTRPRQLETLLGQPPILEIGDAEAALKAAEVQVDSIYTTPRHNHNAIELHAATVAWDGNELRIHDASQLIDLTAGQFADIFGIDQDKVRAPYVGGGFGGKCLWDHQILAVQQQGWPSDRYGSCYRARGCSVWWVVARSPSSEWPSAHSLTAASMR